MKKILLSIVGVVTLTTGNLWGQTNYNFMGLTNGLTVNGYTFSGFTPSFTALGIGGDYNGWDGFAGARDPDNGEPVYDANKYTSEWWIASANGDTGITTLTTKKPDGSYEVEVEVYESDTYTVGGLLKAKFIGPSLDSLNLDEESFEFYAMDPYSQQPTILTPITSHNVPTALSVGDLFPASTTSALYTHFPPVVSGGSGDVIAQAEQLNIGLEFNDGQWTVAQPQ